MSGYRTSYSFDENLRDVPDAPGEMALVVTHLKEELSRPDLQGAEEARLLGQIGVLSRMLGHLDEARSDFEKAVALCEQVGNGKARLVNSIRLAHVYQWQRRFDLSDPLFTEAVSLCEIRSEFSEYLDFALQHYGKSQFDQGNYAEAERLFVRALQLRLPKGDDSLVASSRLALEVTRGRLSDETA